MAERLVEVTWPALLALVDANPNHPSYVGVGSGNIRLPDATYWAMASSVIPPPPGQAATHD